MSLPLASLAQSSPAAGHPIWHFALVAGAGLVTFAGLKASERWKLTGRRLPKPSGPMIVLAVLGLASSVIHGLVCAEHFRVWVVYGVFFVCAAALQAAWSVLVLVRPSRTLLLSGGLGSAAIVFTFALSRTIGMPFGPEAFRPEALNAFGVVATICELAVEAGALYYLVQNESVQSRHRLRAVAA